MLNEEHDADHTARLNLIRAECVGCETNDEAEHFMTCPTCGQAFDLRMLGEVFHHHKAQHEPRART